MVVQGVRVQVIDATAILKKIISISKAAVKKIINYRSIVTQLQRPYNRTTEEDIRLIFGRWRSFPKSTLAIFKSLGCTSHTMYEEIALRTSLLMCGSRLDYG